MNETTPFQYELDFDDEISERVPVWKWIHALRINDLSVDEKRTLVQFAINIVLEWFSRWEALIEPDLVKKHLQLLIWDRKDEVFCAIFLDNKHRIIEFKELFSGSISSATVHPRVVVRESLELNAAAVIFAHNHPSGVAEPSNSDWSITHQLAKALDLIEVRVLDHIVVGMEGCVSFAESGLL